MGLQWVIWENIYGECLRGAVEFKEARWTWDPNPWWKRSDSSSHPLSSIHRQRGTNSHLHTTHTHSPYTERKKETIQPYGKKEDERKQLQEEQEEPGSAATPGRSKVINAVRERPVLQVWMLVFVSRSIRQMAAAEGWGAHVIDILDAF